MKVPFNDLTQQHTALHDEILKAWDAILASTQFVSGREVAAFEEEYAEAIGVPHCVAVSTGTDALLLAAKAVGSPGGRVVVPTNSFVATAEAAVHAGYEVSFADCDSKTSNLSAASLERAVDDETVGIIPVHLYGRPAPMDDIMVAARARGLWVIEDAAQAHLARLGDRPVGSLGDAAAFSFYPGKNLGAPGEGGAITTQDEAVARLTRMLRDHGQREKYRSELIGYNARMSELVAAALRIKLRRLPAWTQERRQIAAAYDQRLRPNPEVRLVEDVPGAWSVHHLYVIHVPDRDEVQRHMDTRGVQTGLHYPQPIHLQPAFQDGAPDRQRYPCAELNASELLSLPIFPGLDADAIEYVCDALEEAVSRSTNVGAPES